MDFAALLDTLLKIMAPVYVALGIVMAVAIVWRAMVQIALIRSRNRVTNGSNNQNVRYKLK